MLGFFVEAMQHGADDYDSFVRQMQIPQRGEEEATDEDVGVSVEQEVAQARLETHAMLSALKEQPEDRFARGDQANLETLKNDADLVADTALGEQTKAILTALDGGVETTPQLEQTVSMLKPWIPKASSFLRRRFTQLSQTAQKKSTRGTSVHFP